MENENQNKNFDLVKQALLNIQENISKVLQLLNKISETSDEKNLDGELEQLKQEVNQIGSNIKASGIQIIEGMFDGQSMISSDGKIYSVPANYASKSKLVEGDILKLSITPDGGFIYKQIGPVERDRLVAKLSKEEGDFYASIDGRKWKLLNASVTYFKGDDGDEVVILVPKGKPAKSAAVENVIKTAK